MRKEIQSCFNDRPVAFKILLALFALAFTKSIFITPFTLIRGLWGVLLGILLWVLVFVICVLALCLLRRVTWQYKPTPVAWTRVPVYMAPVLVFHTFLLLVFFPGKMSWDSMYIWHTTVLGEYTNLHPITYTIFVDFLNNFVNSPWIVIAVQFAYSSFVYAYTAYVFESMGLNRRLCWAIVAILTLYPVNFHQNVTMLKDVPYMVSLVLISAVMLKTIVEDKVSFGKLAALLFISLIAMFSRHNAVLSIPAGFLLFILYYLSRKKTRDALKITALLAVVMAGFFGTNKPAEHALEGDYWKRSNITDVMMMPSAQCSYTILQNRHDMPDDLRKQAERFFQIDYIYYQRDTYPNWAFNNRPLETLNALEVEYNKIEFLRFYLNMLKTYPRDMLFEYQQITGIIWAIPNYGYTLYYNPGIAEYYADIGVEYTPMLPGLAAFLDSKINIVFWLRPALWLMLSILLLFAQPKRQGLKALCLAAPMIANAAMFFAGTPAQNVRYFYCNFSIFLILLLYTLMKSPGRDAGAV